MEVGLRLNDPKHGSPISRKPYPTGPGIIKNKDINYPMQWFRRRRISSQPLVAIKTGKKRCWAQGGWRSSSKSISAVASLERVLSIPTRATRLVQLVSASTQRWPLASSLPMWCHPSLLLGLHHQLPYPPRKHRTISRTVWQRVLPTWRITNSIKAQHPRIPFRLVWPAQHLPWCQTVQFLLRVSPTFRPRIPTRTGREARRSPSTRLIPRWFPPRISTSISTSTSILPNSRSHHPPKLPSKTHCLSQFSSRLSRWTTTLIMPRQTLPILLNATAASLRSGPSRYIHRYIPSPPPFRPSVLPDRPLRMKRDAPWNWSWTTSSTSQRDCVHRNTLLSGNWWKDSTWPKIIPPCFLEGLLGLMSMMMCLLT